MYADVVPENICSCNIVLGVLQLIQDEADSSNKIQYHVLSNERRDAYLIHKI